MTRIALRCLVEFNAQDLANTAWAFATVDLLHELLFAALARAAELMWGGEFKAQDPANMAWAFVTADRSGTASGRSMA